MTDWEMAFPLFAVFACMVLAAAYMVKAFQDKDAGPAILAMYLVLVSTMFAHNLLRATLAVLQS